MWIIKLITSLVMSGIGLMFPSLAPLSPEAEAQKQKDRADAAEGALKAKVEGDDTRKKVDDDIAANPNSLHDPDKFKLP